ncbi:hypothetical protein [Saccharothrix obliqua]|uniref:hypothetical protein n=1 Tax=Saccharothrix obliqua TaxID=2861747 RepID=UPI001C60477A|nr:hypothetical protein [Saccharothrix obliqua]MBW4716775.1 hypothetical protein [Saccharothrix obliqua]
MRRKVVLLVSITVIAGWVLALAVMISGAPEPGAASPEALASALEAALDSRDADALGGLFDHAPADLDRFTAAYLAELDAVGLHDVSVSLRTGATGRQQVVVSDADRVFAFACNVVEHDGRWVLSPTPAL